MSDPRFESLEGTLDAVWSRLEDSTGAGRHVTLATVGLNGGAEARTVGLRSADRATATVEFHTDARTAKVEEIAAEPRATLMLWDPDLLLQIRLRVVLRLLDETDRQERWPRVPQESRRNYAHQPAPGTAMARAEDLIVAPDYDHFAPVEAKVTSIDTVLLEPALHRRAHFEAADGFAGNWLSP